MSRRCPSWHETRPVTLGMECRDVSDLDRLCIHEDVQARLGTLKEEWLRRSVSDSEVQLTVEVRRAASRAAALEVVSRVHRHVCDRRGELGSACSAHALSARARGACIGRDHAAWPFLGGLVLLLRLRGIASPSSTYWCCAGFAGRRIPHDQLRAGVLISSWTRGSARRLSWLAPLATGGENRFGVKQAGRSLRRHLSTMPRHPV